MEEYQQSEIELFEEKANEILEGFCESMTGDTRFTIPAKEWAKTNDGHVNENWDYVYTDRGSRLIGRMSDRLHRLGCNKFGEDAMMDAEISTYLYQED